MKSKFGNIRAGLGTALLLGLAVILSGCANQFEHAMTAADEGEFDRALELWLPLALQGDASAQYNVGIILESGLGSLPPDLDQARYWYEQAADQVVVEAMLRLGVLHERSHDLDKAIAWYQLAARWNDAQASDALARLGAPIPDPDLHQRGVALAQVDNSPRARSPSRWGHGSPELTRALNNATRPGR